MFQQLLSLVNHEATTGRIKKSAVAVLLVRIYFKPTIFYEATDRLHQITDMKVNRWKTRSFAIWY